MIQTIINEQELQKGFCRFKNDFLNNNQEINKFIENKWNELNYFEKHKYYNQIIKDQQKYDKKIRENKK